MADAEPDAAMPHHRVGLVEGLGTLAEHLEIDAQLVGQLRELLFRLRHELVKRRIEEPDRDRQTIHDLEGLADVLLDVDEEVVERRAALLLGAGDDHAAELLQRLLRSLAVEHVLGAEEADAFRSEASRASCEASERKASASS